MCVGFGQPEPTHFYFQLIDFKARLEISKSTVALRDSTLQIIQARFDEGYTHIIDVNQAQIQKATAQVSIPQFKRAIAFTEHNLMSPPFSWISSRYPIIIPIPAELI